MLLKYFYDTALAHASYMVGCQQSGEAIVLDPGRGIQQYLDAAASDDLRIVAVAETHIPQAQRCFLANLPEKLNEFDGDCSLVFQCRSGGRSAIAASLAKAAGVKNVSNMSGGINAWIEAGLPVGTSSSEFPGPDRSASTTEAARQSQAVFWNAKCPSRSKQTSTSI